MHRAVCKREESVLWSCPDGEACHDCFHHSDSHTAAFYGFVNSVAEVSLAIALIRR